MPFRRLLLILLTLLAAGHAAGQDIAPQEIAIDVGFEGTYRAGKWTPVWVEFPAGDTQQPLRAQVTTPDGDGVAATYFPLTDPQPVGGAETVRQLIYARLGRSPTWLTVQLQNEGGVAAERTFLPGSFPAPQPVSSEMILSLGADLGIEAALATSRRRDDSAYVACRQHQTAALPDRWFGYDSIDTVVLSAGSTEYLAGWSDAQIEALGQWVAHGGKLIVSAGGEELPTRWQTLYPGERSGEELLRRTTALEVFSGAGQRLDLVQGGRVEIPVTTFSQYEGKPLLVDQVAGRSEPLFVLHPRGFGMILFSALDLAADPVASWGDRPPLLARLIRMGDEAEAAAGDSRQSGGRVTHIGYRDLSGQLRAALENFRFGGMSLIPFSWVAVLIVLYIVLIGPADYFLLSRLFRRMELTWITFPVAAVSLAVVAVLLTSFYKGDRLAVRQLTVIDHDLASGMQREMLWAHLYSPANARYDLSLAGDRDRLLSWHGLAGAALGGMQTPATATTDEIRYQCRPQESPAGLAIEPEEVPLNTWSTKSLFGYQWQADADSDPQTGLDSANLVEIVDRRLSGQFTNTTGYELVDCQLLYDRWAYAIRGTVAAGDRIHLADEGDPRDLEWKMTRRVVSEDHKAVSTPWNPTDLDVPRIVEVMMFHRAAGGRKYTELSHRQMESLDLSRHLGMGRAVLVGRVKSRDQETGVRGQESGVGLLIDGKAVPPEQDGSWTFVRMVIPVERRSAH